MPHEHEHDHEGSHLSEMELRVRALESVLHQKGYIDPAALDLLIERYEKKIGPRNGARVVAKAWVDQEFKQRLLAEPAQTLASLCRHAGRTHRRRGEHVQTTQYGRVYAVFLLSVANAWASACLVQIGAL